MSMVRTGLQRVAEGTAGLSLRGVRCGLLCHPASVAADLRHAVDLLRDVGVNLVTLFGPEHGVFGEAQDMEGVASAEHPRLGIPVHSLYGSALESLRPRAEQLRGLELVLVDLQDVGSRYYTYVWSMVLMLQACDEVGCPVVVLDRPNPLGGAVEGPSVGAGFTSFVGYHPVAVRHGMTPAELARMAVDDLQLRRVELQVVQLDGWRRSMYFDDTGLPWVLPSPNMPTLETALVYPGCCLLEGTNLSEGRGTTRPFEIVGAPWIDGWALADELRRQHLPGVRFRPTTFCPTFQKHAGSSCGGVQLHVTDRATFRPLLTGVALLAAAHRLWPAQFGWRKQPYEFVHELPAIDLLAGGTWLREGIEAGHDLARLTAGWGEAESGFEARRARHLLYDG